MSLIDGLGRKRFWEFVDVLIGTGLIISKNLEIYYYMVIDSVDVRRCLVLDLLFSNDNEWMNEWI